MSHVPPESPSQTGDGRSKDRMTNYTNFWETDFQKDGAAQHENRLDSYAEVVNGEHAHSIARMPPLIQFLVFQAIMTEQPSFTNMPGQAPSTFLASTKAKHSWHLLRVMNITWRHRCN